MHIHWYRKTGTRICATIDGQYREFRASPEDIEYACLCGAKLYKRHHVRDYPLRLEAPLRPMERARPTNHWTPAPDGGWWRKIPEE